jgi:hypothetical protein
MDNNNQPISNNNPAPPAESPESQNRRDLVAKLGKFAIYAAPFTVAALNAKAAGVGSGPRKH